MRLQHANGSDHWTVTLDGDKQIKLRTSELTRYHRFRMQALIQAEVFLPNMTDQEWTEVLSSPADPHSN